MISQWVFKVHLLLQPILGYPKVGRKANNIFKTFSDKDRFWQLPHNQIDISEWFSNKVFFKKASERFAWIYSSECQIIY